MIYYVWQVLCFDSTLKKRIRLWLTQKVDIFHSIYNNFLKKPLFWGTSSLIWNRKLHLNSYIKFLSHFSIHVRNVSIRKILWVWWCYQYLWSIENRQTERRRLWIRHQRVKAFGLYLCINKQKPNLLKNTKTLMNAHIPKYTP